MSLLWMHQQSAVPSGDKLFREADTRLSSASVPGGVGVERLDFSFCVGRAGKMKKERAEDQFGDDRGCHLLPKWDYDCDRDKCHIPTAFLTPSSVIHRMASSHSCTKAGQKTSRRCGRNEESQVGGAIPKYSSLCFYTVISKPLKNSLFHTHFSFKTNNRVTGSCEGIFGAVLCTLRPASANVNTVQHGRTRSRTRS